MRTPVRSQRVLLLPEDERGWENLAREFASRVPAVLASVARIIAAKRISRALLAKEITI